MFELNILENANETIKNLDLTNAILAQTIMFLYSNNELYGLDDILYRLKILHP